MVPLSVMAPMRKLAATYALSVTAYAVPALPKGEPRGGYQPPGCFSLWKNNVGAKRRQCSIKYGKIAEIAAGYPLSHDAFSIFAAAYTLSVTAFSRASSPKGRAKGRALPARRTEISAG